MVLTGLSGLSGLSGQFGRTPSAPTSPSALVSGAGTAEANGTYTQRGTANGKPYYNLVGQPDDFQFSSVYWDGSAWVISLSDATVAYGNSGEDVPHPWESAEWNTVDGAEPAPTVVDASSIMDVATNDDKLRLTGISAGQLVRITGESNRIERYNGPDETAGGVFVSGAGTTEANGLYTPRGTHNDKPYYNLLGTSDDFTSRSINWDGASWLIILATSEDGAAYSGAEDVATPDLVSMWFGADLGLEPAPTVSVVTQGELSAGVTVSGAGTSNPLGGGSGLVEVDGTYTRRGAAFGRNYYNMVGHADTQPTNEFGAGAQYCTYWSPDPNLRWRIADSEDGGAFDNTTDSLAPWVGTWEANDSLPPAPTVTRNDIASEANWEVMP